MFDKHDEKNSYMVTVALNGNDDETSNNNIPKKRGDLQCTEGKLIIKDEAFLHVLPQVGRISLKADMKKCLANLCLTCRF